MGTQLSSPKKGAEPSPKFSVNVHCGKTAGWVKMPVGTEVKLGPGDVVFDGVAAPPLRGAQSPSFQFMSIVAKWLDG